jgi:hypothetical protein
MTARRTLEPTDECTLDKIAKVQARMRVWSLIAATRPGSSA